MQNGLHLLKRPFIGLLVMLAMCMSSCEDRTRYFPNTREAKDECWQHSYNLLRSIYPTNKQEYANRLSSSGQISYMEVTNSNQDEFWLWSGVADWNAFQAYSPDGYFGYCTVWNVAWYADPNVISMDDPRIILGKDLCYKLKSHTGIFTSFQITYLWENGGPVPVKISITNQVSGGSTEGSAEYAIKLLNLHNVKLGIPINGGAVHQSHQSSVNE